MNGRIHFPAQPMVGVIGVATAGAEVETRFAGEHGGNLDDHWHGAGATVYLPVRRPAALRRRRETRRWASGEICFTGVECAGEVDIRLGLLRRKRSGWPVAELAGSWLPHATASTFEGVQREVAEEAARLLVGEWGFSLEEAFVFLSVACDLGITQGAAAPRPATGSSRVSASPGSTLAPPRSGHSGVAPIVARTRLMAARYWRGCARCASPRP